MVKLTPNQQAAVELRGGPVLVSAAAGAGKTRVLVERLMGWLTADPPQDIDRFLLITYTRAAAGEMRERILAGLREHLKDSPQRLMKQTALAHTAWICTLHSYCLEIYREHHAAAGLPPELRMGDETELELLRAQALDAVLDELFEQTEDAGFEMLANMGVTRSGDRRLGTLVRSVWEKIRDYADTGRDTRCLDIARRECWEPALAASAETSLAQWTERLCALRESLPPDDAKGAKRLERLIADARTLRAAAARGWEDLRAALTEVKLPPAKTRREQDVCEAWIQLFRKKLESLRETFYGTAEEGAEDAQAVLPAASALLDAARRFDGRYRAEKESRRLMDYHDLERYALKILRDEQGNPTDAAKKLSGRFTEILVDEYQDINPAQDRIVNLLSRGGRNVFYVGDARQSVYRFQNAEPELFMSKHRRFTPFPERREGEGVRLSLPDNFRSRPEIIEAVNHVCSRLMVSGSGEIVYEPLSGGGNREPDKKAEVEWLVTDTARGEDGERGQTAAEAEARTVARRLRELIDEGDAQPEDCVILLRSPRTRAKVYRKALADAGITGKERADGADWLRAPELLALVGMLSAADNPTQDIPLIAMLRAPGYGFSSQELALLRAEGPAGAPLYDCLRASEREKARRALSDLREWRVLAPEWPVWRLAARLAARGELARLTGGEAERRLDAFIELARSAPEGLSLSGFLRWLSALREGKPPVSPSSGGHGAVRIMSIHAAKGLEFPVVVLASLHSAFHLRDASEPALAHDAGLALLRREDWAEYPTPPYRLLAERMVWQQKAEEQRLLYVAMTRAERRLIFSHAEGNPDLWRQRFFAGWDGPAEGLAQEGGSFADWLTWAGDARRWRVSIVKPEELPEGSVFPSACVPEPVRAEPFRYAHEKSVALPSKMTFGELKGRAADFEVREEARQGFAREQLSYAPPGFGPKETRGLTAAERGSAAHRVLRQAELERCVTAEGARAELERVSRGMTPAQKNSLDPDMLYKLALSPLGERMRRADRLYRECKFSYLEDSALVPGIEGVPGESVLLQGVIDCFFEEGGVWAVVDYKTDARENPEEHREQLAFYERAVRRITGAQRTEAFVYYLKTHTIGCVRLL